MSILRNILIGFPLLLCTAGSAQEETTNRPVAFGFSVGMDYGALQLDPTSAETRTIDGAGFRMGTLFEFRMDEAWSILSHQELSFNSTRVEQMNGSDVQRSYKVYPALLDISAQASRGWLCGTNRISMMLGPMLRIPANSSTNEDFMSPISRTDVAVDFGVGFEQAVSDFHIAWELRYAHGLRDLFDPAQQGDLRFSTLIFNICFKG